MAEESKNEYAAQLQRFNRDQAHFYFSQMPQIFDVSAPSPQPHLPEKPPAFANCYTFVKTPANLSIERELETNSNSERYLYSSCSLC